MRPTIAQLEPTRPNCRHDPGHHGIAPLQVNDGASKHASNLPFGRQSREALSRQNGAPVFTSAPSDCNCPASDVSTLQHGLRDRTHDRWLIVNAGGYSVWVPNAPA
jgi:hypothetical protein